jgi:uncharacterized protein (UPF0276 family)
MRTKSLFVLGIFAVVAQSSMVMNQTSTSQQQIPSFGIGRPVLVHITTGDNKSNYEVHSATMGVDHALAMLRAGKDVSILLDVNGVYIAAKKCRWCIKTN